MTTLLSAPPTPTRTLADLLADLGDIDPARVVADPAPGTATEADLLALSDHTGRLYELVDGTLVEKAVGFRESILAFALGGILRAFVIPRNLGLVSGPDDTMRLFPGLVRMPDVAFISWDRFPDRRVPEEPIPSLAPDLAIEVLSASNTPKEMARKRREYFQVGVRLVWMVDRKTRTVAVYTSPDQFVTLDESQALDGGAVLPGFALPLRDLFVELDRRGA